MMRYRQCRSCSFWVTRGERFCTNCGVHRPYQSGRGQRSAWLVFTTMLGGVLGGSVFYRPGSSLLVYGCIAGCATGLAWGLGLFAEVSAILQGRRRAPSLQTSELRLAGRLAEILHTKRQVRDLLGRLRAEACTAASGQLLTILRKAEGAVERAVRRYTAELAKLELIRWRNGWSRCWRSRHRTAPTPTRGNGWTKSIATVSAATACWPRGAAPAWTPRSWAGTPCSSSSVGWTPATASWNGPSPSRRTPPWAASPRPNWSRAPTRGSRPN